MFSQVRQALDSLAGALDAVDSASTGELRDALALAKPLRARLETLETAVASKIAARERHGDGGAGVLHQIAAVPRSDAARNVRVAAELEHVPDAQSALADGDMCMANAARLARAARSTSPEAVQEDSGLVEMAKTLPPDEFAHASQRWTAKHQSAGDVAERHRRNRRNRNVRFWNGEDGTVQMRGAFDAEMGARIQSRIRDEAERLRQADRRLQRALQSAGAHAAADDGRAFDAMVPDAGVRGGMADRDDAVRTRDQRMADALDTILTSAGPARALETDDQMCPRAASRDCTATVSSRRADEGTDSGGLVAIGPVAVGQAASGTSRNDEPSASTACDGTSLAATVTGCGCSGSDGAALGETHPAEYKNPATQIIVRADLENLLSEHGGTGEIAGTGPVPGSVVDRLCCNGEVSIVLFDTELNPVYEAVVSRAPTAAQRRALIARDGGCIGCGAPPGECEAHHIIPWKRGGPTKIDNLVLVCWSCHDKIHDHNWQVTKRRGRYRLMPPDAKSAPNPAPSRKPARAQRRSRTGRAALIGEPTPSGKSTRPSESAVSGTPTSRHGSAPSGAPALFP